MTVLKKMHPIFLCAGIVWLLSACGGTAPQTLNLPENVSKESGESVPEKEPLAPSKGPSAEPLPDTVLRQTETQNLSVEKSSASDADTLQASEPEALQKSEPEDVYLEISRLARNALSRADSFYASGNLDSAAAIVERFTVLNPLWEEWKARADALAEKIRQGHSRADENLKGLLIGLVNANARRADYAEVRSLADSILKFSPGDSVKALTDSVVRVSFGRTFQKVQKGRDSALSIAAEKARFDEAEKILADLMMRYADFNDTLELSAALMKVSSLRSEADAVASDYWKKHDPKAALDEGRKLSAKSEWKKAKEIFRKLKASDLRGEAIRELSTLGTNFCVEKRKNAARLFSNSKEKKSAGRELLQRAVSELDSCLEFFPEYADRATVLSNKDFLLRESLK